jgi:hypothetical protein
MPVSDERQAQIRELSCDERVDRIDTSAFTAADWQRLDEEVEAETLAFCRENTDAEELHYFVSWWNWDKGTWALEEVLRNPSCEAATALSLYWRARPEYYLQFSDRDAVPSFQVEDFDFIMALEKRYLAGEFPAGSIYYDPADPSANISGLAEVGVYDDLKDQFVRAIPAKMYEPVNPKS